eukprot:gnl/TRDRNA2_/TRDRNA2_154618_c6_seq1.p1 gnl/TRDRNA2_/TRDRNA2_154618_c6~~gnl/TRDRNA2_/TRDRNA2_154618_c6_seq1.p1  ORF type:complete len:140 (-),score=16.53 gnl/TRDRNA2_/TRDRNA2_154618_c6_seq1:149-568(-)
MEQHMSAGTPYVRSFYYDSKDRMRGLRDEPILALARTASKFVKERFPMPVSIDDNLSAEGKVLRDLGAIAPDAIAKIADLRNTVWDCVRAIWNEYVVYEIGPWAPGGTCDKWATPSANINTLRTLRKKHGLPGFGAAEG